MVTNSILEPSTFRIQAGYVEGVKENEHSYTSMESMYKELFKNTKECLTIHWNNIPFILNYPNDIPELVFSIIELLENLVFPSNDNFQAHLQSDAIDILLHFHLKNSDEILVEGKFTKTRGKLESVLNGFSEIKIKLEDFLYEWKLLLEQLVVSYQASGSTISKQQNSMDRILRLNSLIELRPLRYRYELRKG